MKTVQIVTIILFIWSIFLFIFACYEHHKGIAIKIRHFWSIGIISLCPSLSILIVFLLRHDNNLFKWLEILLIFTYLMTFIFNILETLYLYVKPMFINLKFIHIIYGVIIFYILFIIFGIIFKELVLENSISSLYKFVGLLGALYSVMYVTIHHYDNFYFHEKKFYNDYKSLEELKNNKVFIHHSKLMFLVMFIQNISIMYMVVFLVLINNFFSKSLINDIKCYQIHWTKLLSPAVMTLSNYSFSILAVSLFSVIIITAYSRYFIKKFYNIKFSADFR